MVTVETGTGQYGNRHVQVNVVSEVLISVVATGAGQSGNNRVMHMSVMTAETCKGQ